MSEKRNYYAIIPANVRYDENLPPNAKLLYGEITALCNEKGFCWASNKYFAELYNVSYQTISNWINALKGANHIKVEYKYENGTQKILGRSIKIFDGGTQKNLKDNNTFNNTYNIYSLSKKFDDQLPTYDTSKNTKMSDEEEQELLRLTRKYDQV